jgi:SAM-dependent methyltransferase
MSTDHRSNEPRTSPAGAHHVTPGELLAPRPEEPRPGEPRPEKPRETAGFVLRRACISCDSPNLEELSSGRFDEGSLARFIDEDPWGEHPAPFLRGERWSYVACRTCGLAFHRRILDPVWNERRFSRWMSREAIEHERRGPRDRFRRGTAMVEHVHQLELLTRPLRGDAAPRVLDFGCGSGGFLSLCATHGFEAWGVDRSAARREGGVFDRVVAALDDVQPHGPFHAVTLFEVLEHLDQPRELLARLRELLVPGGVLVLETPDCTGVRGIVTREDYARIHPLEHINGFTPETLTAFAERVGFAPASRPTAWITCEPVQVARTLAKRLFRGLQRPTTRLTFRKA